MMKTMAFKQCVLIFLILFLISGIACAATLTLPSGLKTIEAEAFMNDASLDEVVIPEGVEAIGDRAFFGTSISKLTLPESLTKIGEKAFDGCDGMAVSAPRGSWAFEWALKAGYLKGETDAVTEIIVDETLHAGKDLTVSVIGASNTVSHSLYLVNEADNTRTSRMLYKSSGSVTWNGYELEPGNYRIMVYTVTDKFLTLSPVSKSITIVGTKPEGPEISFPETMQAFSDTNIIRYENADAVYIKVAELDSSSNIVNTYDNWFDNNDIYIWTSAEELENGGTVEIEYSTKSDGIWNRVRHATIIVTPVKRLGSPDIVFPEEIFAGHDLVLRFDPVENVTGYYVELYDQTNKPLIYFNEDASNTAFVIPGYILDAGEYRLRVFSSGNDAESERDYLFNVTGMRIAEQVVLSLDNINVYVDDYINISVSAPGHDTVVIKDTQDDWLSPTIYMLDEAGNVTFGRYASERDGIMRIAACVETSNGYSAWTDFEFAVKQRETLSRTVIDSPEVLEVGCDLHVSWTEVPNAEWYEVNVHYAYVDDGRIYGTTVAVGNELSAVIPGYCFGKDFYKIEVVACAENYGSSSASMSFRVTGNWREAPTVLLQQDTVRINSPAVFTIDTSGADQVRVIRKIDGYGTNTSNIDVTGNETEWRYTPSESYRNQQLTLQFSVHRDERWSSWKTLTYTIEDLEQLAQPVIMQKARIRQERISRFHLILWKKQHGMKQYCVKAKPG